MDFMNVLSLAIGMVTVYLVFALSVTAFNEAIAALLSSRGKWLLKGVASLYSKTTDGFDMAQARRVMAAPQIAYLHGGAGLRPSYVPAWTMLQAMLHVAQPAEAEAKTISTVADVRALATGLPAGTPIRVALDDLLAAGDSSLADFRQRFEAWFTLFEGQLGAWYRQRTQLVVGAISLLVVGLLNVDTLSLVNQLATTPQLREAMVQQAQKALAPAASASEPLTAEQMTLAMKQVRRATDQFQSSGLRVGWSQDDFQLLRQSHTAKVQKLVGLLLSALAVALGAPFWFDLLKGLIAIRSVGKNLLEAGADQPHKPAPAGPPQTGE